MVYSTSVISKELGLTNDAVLARARKLRISPAEIEGKLLFWSREQIAQLRKQPKTGRPRKAARK